MARNSGSIAPIPMPMSYPDPVVLEDTADYLVPTNRQGWRSTVGQPIYRTVTHWLSSGPTPA